jgi:hypothetical protein
MRNKAFLVAPVALMLGVLGLQVGYAPNRDLDWDVALPLWTGAHLAYLVGYGAIAFVVMAVWTWARDAARSPTERAAVHALAVVSSVGLVAMAGQMVIDLLVGFEAGSRAEMSAIFDRYQAIPGFEMFFYGVVPALSFAGLSLLIVWLAVRGRVGWWPALLFLAGTAAVGTQITALMIVGGVGVGIALYAITRRAGLGASAVSVPATSVGGR